MNPALYHNRGSNNGDRRANIARAVAAISHCILFKDAEIALSTEIESEPGGFDSTARFVNIGVAIRFRTAFRWSEPQLRHILGALQKIERSISPMPHRNPDGTYRDRDIDIDIIAADALVCDTPALTLPHPRMHLRPFVLEPMAELAPAWRHPLLGATAAELLKQQQP